MDHQKRAEEILTAVREIGAIESARAGRRAERAGVQRYCDTVALELEIVARGIRYAGMKRLASAGDAALRTLAIAKVLNRTGLVMPHLDAIRRALGSTRRKR
jgi:hypothetical protein